MELNISKREVAGKKMWAYRKKWMIPGVIYGRHLKSPVSIFFAKNEFMRVYKDAWTSTVVNLTWDSKEMVLIHDYQVDGVKDTLLHVDFLAVKSDEKVEAEIHVVLTWESSLEKLGLGRVQLVRDHIRVSAFPQNLPRDIQIDISKITTLDDGIFVKDIDLWDKVEILDEETLAVVAAIENTSEDEADNTSTTTDAAPAA